ncbi:MAG: FHA domain-containing protein, partial [Deltaproteobacteria bacterium]|nr:FHA domain-containing protein [Deltaproteobacteria bacterium]MBW2531059.1 FHA domain-containing protein [Deltaproteobacteria bacterium]
MSDGPPKDSKKRRRSPPTPTADRLVLGTTARFVVLSGAQLGKTYAFQFEAHIGRGSDADIVLDDTEVSRRHVRVWQTDHGEYMIEDHGSRNGTLVNGVPVTRSALKLGDKIQLGSRVLLLFSARDPMEDQVLQRQRLEALGRLGTGIAHDFNNMLGVVLTNL